MKPWAWVAIGLLVLLLLGGAVLIGKGYLNGKPIDVRIKPIGGGQYLEESAAGAWLAMVAAAKAAGLDLHSSGPDSAFRSPEQQTSLLGSRGAYGAGGFAAQVGYSPHQTGKAIDVACVSPGTANYSAALDQWLTLNAPSFGWYRVGLSFKTVEPWHLEYKFATSAPAVA